MWGLFNIKCRSKNGLLLCYTYSCATTAAAFLTTLTTIFHTLIPTKCQLLGKFHAIPKFSCQSLKVDISSLQSLRGYMTCPSHKASEDALPTKTKLHTCISSATN